VEPLEAIESAQVAGFAQRTVKRRDLGAAKSSTFGGLEMKVWRTKQSHARDAREIRADAREQNVHNGRVRFGRQRKRVEHLVWDTGSTKHFTREVHIRQPLAYNECRAVENVASSGNFIAHPPGEFDHLVFAISRHDDGGRGKGQGGSSRKARGNSFCTHLFDSWQPLMYALVKAARKRRFSHHDIDTLQPREASEEIPVNGIQTVSIRGAIAHGNDDVPPRLIGFCAEQTFADGMLVDTSSLLAASFEFAECRSQETGLPNEPFGPSILFGAVQPSERQTLEVVHRLLMPLQRIEELEHGADESRPDPKRRFRARFDCHAAGNGQERLPFLDRERTRVLRRPLEQPIVQLGSRHHVRKNCCRRFAQPIFNRPQQVVRRCTGRHDDKAVAAGERRTFRRKRRQGASKRPEVRRPHEASRAGRDH
jgi:hypothetical protein